MDMCKVYGVGSQKGGVGKSSLTLSLGVELANQGYKVALIDADGQGSLTASMGYKEPDSMEITLSTILEKEINDETYDEKTFGILHHEEGVDLIPCNIELSGLEVSLVNVWSREMVLSRYIEKIRDDYDFIIIDCQPSLSLMTLNVFAAADKIIIPVQAAYLSLKGLEQLIMTIGKVKRGLNSRLGIAGIVVTMLNDRTRYAREIVTLLDEAYGESVNIYDTKIPFSVRAAEATAEGISIFKYEPNGNTSSEDSGSQSNGGGVFVRKRSTYAQRPDATACASIDIWNDRMHCWVNKGASRSSSVR